MFRTEMKSLLVQAVAFSLCVALAGTVQAQSQSFNAAGQGRQRFLESHQRTGTVGNGYRPYSAWTYQNSAASHAQALSAYGEGCQQLPPETAKEHLAEVRRNVTATKKEISKLGPDVEKDAELKKTIDSLQKTLAECEELCGHADAAIGDKEVQSKPFCAHCSSLTGKLEQARKQHDELIQKLGIPHPAAAAAAPEGAKAPAK
jgi:cytochrome c556